MHVFHFGIKKRSENSSLIKFFIWFFSSSIHSSPLILSVLNALVEKQKLTNATITSNQSNCKSNICHCFIFFHSNKLLSILNLLCNTTQNSSITVRDACYGCFFRVGVLPPGASLLSQLSQCANTYLANTSYAGCASQLAVSKFFMIF